MKEWVFSSKDFIFDVCLCESDTAFREHADISQIIVNGTTAAIDMMAAVKHTGLTSASRQRHRSITKRFFSKKYNKAEFRGNHSGSKVK
jgi:hypothetical protein